MTASLSHLERAILELLLDGEHGLGHLPYNVGREDLDRRGLDVGDVAAHSLANPYCQAVLSLHARGLLDLSQVLIDEQRPLPTVAQGEQVSRLGGPIRVYPERYSEIHRLLALSQAQLGRRHRLSVLAA